MRRKSNPGSETQQQPEDFLSNSSFFRSAADAGQQQRRREWLSTSSEHLDDLLSGGLETGELTQFYGTRHRLFF